MSLKLLDDYPMIVDRILARTIGLNEAIVLQHLHYWIVKNKEKNINYKNGKYWTFNSIQKWHDESFDFWSESTLRRIFASLEEKGLLIVGNFNKMKFDRTKWYSIDYEKLDKIVGEKKKIVNEKNINDVNNEFDEMNINNENNEFNGNDKSNKNKSAGIYEKIVAKMNKKTKDDDENNLIKLNESIDSNCKSAIAQYEPMNYAKSSQCNSLNLEKEISQYNQSNTNNYTENTEYITQPLPDTDVVELEKEKKMLKEFLGKEYTDGYVKRINDLLKAKCKGDVYLEEKIKVAKTKNPISKCGYLYAAVKYDYKEREGNFSSYGIEKEVNNFINSGYGKKNKFKNFEETVYKYTEEELEARVKEHNRRKYGDF